MTSLASQLPLLGTLSLQIPSLLKYLMKVSQFNVHYQDLLQPYLFLYSNLFYFPLYLQKVQHLVLLIAMLIVICFQLWISMNGNRCRYTLLLVAAFWELVITPGIEQVHRSCMQNEEMLLYFEIPVLVCLWGRNKSILQILPSDLGQVFSVSKNKFTIIFFGRIYLFSSY